jgi:GNAT superfamily N-acetyltransferase
VSVLGTGQRYRRRAMPPPEVVPFADDHLDAAAKLLAARHRRQRGAEPLLPQRFEDPAVARAEVEALWRADDTSGAVAFRDRRLVGFVVGGPKMDAAYGENVWIDGAGHAVEQADDARDLYALAAARWVGEGRTRHYVQVPAADAALVDAWFRLGFGQHHASGIRELSTDAAWPEGVREADERDIDAIVALALLLREHHARAPAFSSSRPESDHELREAIFETMVAPEATELVAEAGGRIVGNFAVKPVERSSLHIGLARPESAAALVWAVTLPDVRGTGAGVALTEASFAWARSRGYESMVTDWRVTNLLASRFWPRRGFRTSFLRLYRHIP